jgi:glycosyltransferase involved in cell wall biosynthesis
MNIQEQLPLVSIILPTIELDEYFQLALKSCIEQDYPNLEIIVIINNPLIFSSCGIPQSSLHEIRTVFESRQGISWALNTGIAASKGEYIARMDADDICIKNRISCQVEHIIKEKADICFGKAMLIDNQGKPIKMTRSPIDSITSMNILRSHISEKICVGDLIHPSALIKSSVFKVYGLYAHMPCEDFEMWCRCDVTYTFFDSVCLFYRRHAGGLSRKNADNNFIGGISVVASQIKKIKEESGSLRIDTVEMYNKLKLNPVLNFFATLNHRYIKFRTAVELNMHPSLVDLIAFAFTKLFPVRYCAIRIAIYISKG